MSVNSCQAAPNPSPSYLGDEMYMAPKAIDKSSIDDRQMITDMIHDADHSTIFHLIDGNSSLINALDKLGDTPLMTAVFAGKTETAKLLVTKYKADVNAKRIGDNLAGSTALHTGTNLVLTYVKVKTNYSLLTQLTSYQLSNKLQHRPSSELTQ